KAKGVALLDTNTGQLVPGFKPAALDGVVFGVKLSGGHLFVAGSFTVMQSIPHAGIGTLNPLTGAVDPYMNVQLAGHHNYNGTGSNGAVGPRKLAVSPDGKRLIAIGNFKTADGVQHDQIVLIDIDGAAAVVDPNWNTLAYTAACFRNA